ncbi:TPA: hypothetical protein N0F65_011925 [Lagenidium giganteum]|uniref:EF-hand domain-containing protein n=1 Tax=Lagenidium giganteum TaxID=4803 RepID=A0AAV2YPW0_9STRA|nr:TPA: hypothetical protein N0F65_011925 [Lagenidium giganteum]
MASLPTRARPQREPLDFGDDGELTETAMRLSRVIEREQRRRSALRGSAHMFRLRTRSPFPSFKRLSRGSRGSTKSTQSRGSRGSLPRRSSAVSPAPDAIPEEQDKRASAPALVSSTSSMPPQTEQSPPVELGPTKRSISHRSSRGESRRLSRTDTMSGDTHDETPSSLMMRLWIFFDDPQSSQPAYYFSIAIFFFILLSTAVFILQTEQALVPYMAHLNRMETTCSMVFTAELIARFLVAPGKIAFLRSHSNWIDFIAIFPYYLEAIMQVENAGSFGAIRVVRLTRVVRVLKMSRYSSAIQVFVQAISISIKALSMLVFLMGIAMIVLSSCIYFAEYTPYGCRRWEPEDCYLTMIDSNTVLTDYTLDGCVRWFPDFCSLGPGYDPSADASGNVTAYALGGCRLKFPDYCSVPQAANYSSSSNTMLSMTKCECKDDNPYMSIASSFWWCIVTMSTVGYGDDVPVTVPGKLVGSVTILTGMLVLALPITVIGTNFQKVMKSVVHQTMNSNVEYLKGKRQLCRDEIQAILQAFHAVTEDIHLDIDDIINVYDTDNSGMLEDDELARFRHDLEVLQNRAFASQHSDVGLGHSSSSTALTLGFARPPTLVRPKPATVVPHPHPSSIGNHYNQRASQRSQRERTERQATLPTLSVTPTPPDDKPQDIRKTIAIVDKASDAPDTHVLAQQTLGLKQMASVEENFAELTTTASIQSISTLASISRTLSPVRQPAVQSSYSSVDDDLMVMRLLELQRNFEDRLLETEQRLEAKLNNITKILIRVEELMERDDD